MSTFDVILLTIIILIIVVLFTINISSVIDNKLSNVEINLPPINIPDPQITVKIQKSCGSENYDVYIDKPNNTLYQNTVSLSPINTKEHFESDNTPSSTVKNPEISPIKNIKLQKQESLPEEKPSSEENNVYNIDGIAKSEESVNLVRKDSEKHVHFSSDDNIVSYGCSNDKDSVYLTCRQLENGEFKCIKNHDSSLAIDNKKSHSDTCQNQSLIDNKRDVYKHLIKNNITTDSFPICDSSSYHDIVSGDNDCDPINYHRQYEYYIKSYLEDPVVRGYNITEYNHNASLDQIGKIKLTKDYKNPKPSGYIFDSSPIYEK